MIRNARLPGRIKFDEMPTYSFLVGCRFTTRLGDNSPLPFPATSTF